MSFFWQYTITILFLSASASCIAAYATVKHLMKDYPKKKGSVPKFENPPPPPPRSLTTPRINRETAAIKDLSNTLFNSDLHTVQRDKIIEVLLENLKDDFFKAGLQIEYSLFVKEDFIPQRPTTPFTQPKPNHL